MKTGRPWSKKEIHAAVERGPHESALTPEAIRHFAQEAREKVAAGTTRVVLWDTFKKSMPKDTKISPIAAIPHKSRAYRSILDLSFSLQLKQQERVPSVNENSIKTAPEGAINQLGHVLMRIVHAFAEAPLDALILGAKWDITNGFWRLDCEQGQEYNFCYVLPQ